MRLAHFLFLLGHRHFLLCGHRHFLLHLLDPRGVRQIDAFPFTMVCDHPMSSVVVARCPLHVGGTRLVARCPQMALDPTPATLRRTTPRRPAIVAVKRTAIFVKLVRVMML